MSGFVVYICCVPTLYIIAGPNGAGKTTASYNLMPQMINCKEYVNADEIARGLSPFNPEGVAIEAGRIMLERIEELVEHNDTFALETTLTTKYYVNLINRCKAKGYEISLIYFYLKDVQISINRVKERVANGGHNIPTDVIERRYPKGLKNLVNLFIPICNYWIVADNTSYLKTERIAEGSGLEAMTIHNQTVWNKILAYGA